ncbi:MAG: VWA domain-containing protein [Chloroflexi bacterium]|nr:VWA domain-containing protein [Chloroflexota bacterium]
MRDPAIVPNGPREAVDGHRLLERAVGFGRELRRAGLAVDVGAEIDFARALGFVDIGDREVVRAAGAAVFTRRRDDRHVYDRVFDRYWRRRSLLPNLEAPGGDQRPEAIPADDGTPQEGAMPGDERSELPEDRQGIPIPTDGEPNDDNIAPDVITISPDAYSRSETMRHRDFDRMTAQELRDAERLVDLLEPRLELRRTRRYELHRHGRRLAPREMFRRNLGNGGEILTWVWRRKVQRPRPLVVLCDISGSMERHSRLLLRFIQALSASSTVKAESFVFGTRLTRVTRLLKDRNRDRALAKVADTVTDWAGGTRIGESFRDFNHKWARRTLRSSGVVIVVSDGWDRGDPRLVDTETARLRRNCHRLVWLNPLAGTPGYQPLAAGMRAAFPYIDDFLAAGTVASLERLGEILSAGYSGDTRRGSEAAAHSAPGPDGVRTFSPPPRVARQPADPFAAQPLR